MRDEVRHETNKQNCIIFFIIFFLFVFTSFIGLSFVNFYFTFSYNTNLLHRGITQYQFAITGAGFSFRLRFSF